MYNITASGNTVKISDGTREWGFPKGTLIVHADKGDEQSVDIKLKASRKVVLSFNYKLCNMAQGDAEQTAGEIAKII